MTAYHGRTARPNLTLTWRIDHVAYRIAATTETDRQLLQQIRDLAWAERQDVSHVIREAFLGRLYGPKSKWPKEWRHVDSKNAPDRH